MFSGCEVLIADKVLRLSHNSPLLTALHARSPTLFGNIIHDLSKKVNTIFEKLVKSLFLTKNLVIPSGSDGSAAGGGVKRPERVAGVGGQRSRIVGKATTGHPNSSRGIYALSLRISSHSVRRSFSSLRSFRMTGGFGQRNIILNS